METIQRAGLTFIHTIQSGMPGLDGIMNFFSDLGRENFYMGILAFLFWCFDRRLGMRLLLIIVLADFSNTIFKWLFHGPRPYWIEPSLLKLGTEESFGIPSGHAQNAVAFWGYLIYEFRSKKMAWIAGIAIIALISFSRMYLGVHFPHDVLFGWFLGFVLLFGTILFASKIEKRLHDFSPPSAFISGVAGAFFMVLAAQAIRGFVLWGNPDLERTALSMKGPVSDAAIIAGLGLSAVILPGFHAETTGRWYIRLARFIVGILGILLIRLSGSLLVSDETLLSLLFRALRYSLIGLWAVRLAPWVFVVLGLSKKERVTAD